MTAARTADGVKPVIAAKQRHRQTHRDRPRPPPDQQKAHEKGDVHAGHRHNVREPASARA